MLPLFDEHGLFAVSGRADSKYFKDTSKDACRISMTEMIQGTLLSSGMG